MGKTSSVQLMSGLLVVATGAVYLLLEYSLDRILTVSSGQLVIAGLVLVLAALTNGIVFLKPTAMKIVKASWPDDPNAAIPEAVRALQGRLLRGSMVNTAIVVVVLFLMVSAATGGF